MNHDTTIQRTSEFIDNKNLNPSINRYKLRCFYESDILFEPFECDNNFNATKGWFDISTMTWHGRK